MATVAPKARLKIADEVCIIMALLHREHPNRLDFTIEEVMERARKEGLTRHLRSGFYVHVVQHCVANRPPNPGRYRMLFETAPGRRRIFRESDSYHPQREGSKIMPSREDLPPRYSGFLAWYRAWSSAAATKSRQEDPLLSLRGSGKRLWAKEHADEYVCRLREGWE